MEATAYNSAAWRALPRDHCIVERLFGPLVGPCSGSVHRHHVDPSDPASRTVPSCAGHHARLHVAIRALTRGEKGKRAGCPHRPGTHRYPHAKRECDRRHGLIVDAEKWTAAA